MRAGGNCARRGETKSVDLKCLKLHLELGFMKEEAEGLESLGRAIARLRRADLEKLEDGPPG